MPYEGGTQWFRHRTWCRPPLVPHGPPSRLSARQGGHTPSASPVLWIVQAVVVVSRLIQSWVVVLDWYTDTRTAVRSASHIWGSCFPLLGEVLTGMESPVIALSDDAARLQVCSDRWLLRGTAQIKAVLTLLAPVRQGWQLMTAAARFWPRCWHGLCLLLLTVGCALLATQCSAGVHVVLPAIVHGMG